MTIADTPMFDVLDLLTGDGPRARRSDPLQSHVAADKSQETITAVKAAVLLLVRQKGALDGAELNELYAARRDRNGWPMVHWDSPRKRAGDLHRDGQLKVLNADAPRGTAAEYTLLGVTS